MFRDSARNLDHEETVAMSPNLVPILVFDLENAGICQIRSQ